MKNLVFHSIGIPSISFENVEIPGISLRIWNFEILGFLHLELEILSISSEIPNILKTWNFD